MYLIRRAQAKDIDLMLKLAKMVHFINLPADKEIITEKVQRSRISFRAVARGEETLEIAGDRSAVGQSPLFVFVIEDTSTGNALGCSMVVSKMGGPDHPNIAFDLTRREFFSKDLQMGTTQVTAKLIADTSSPTEIGGLILGPSFRRHPARLGKQISLIRFHFIGAHRRHFADTVLAEMMAPITPDGRNTLWEFLGRRFINLSYSEADKFCQHSREFMLNLLPREEIYLSLLPPEARALVGEVGPDTMPARRMLESLGFAYNGRIDPFDGGPHLNANTDDIELVRDTFTAPLAGAGEGASMQHTGFVSSFNEDGEFRAMYSSFERNGTESISLPAETISMLETREGDDIACTPIDLGVRPSYVGELRDTKTAP
ncbi:MAG: arginine N-succinyltransferase [Planctomycetota bacterium]